MYLDNKAATIQEQNVKLSHFVKTPVLALVMEPEVTINKACNDGEQSKACSVSVVSTISPAFLLMHILVTVETSFFFPLSK